MQSPNYCGGFFVVLRSRMSVHKIETETTPQRHHLCYKHRGEEAPPRSGHHPSAIGLSLNSTIVRTDFHCLAIYNALMRLDFDKLGSSDFNMKLHCNL